MYATWRLRTICLSPIYPVILLLYFLSDSTRSHFYHLLKCLFGCFYSASLSFQNTTSSLQHVIRKFSLKSISSCNIKYNFTELSLFSHLIQTRIIRLSCLASRTNFHRCNQFPSISSIPDFHSLHLFIVYLFQLVSIPYHPYAQCFLIWSSKIKYTSVLSGEPHKLSPL